MHTKEIGLLEPRDLLLVPGKVRDDVAAVARHQREEWGEHMLAAGLDPCALFEGYQAIGGAEDWVGTVASPATITASGSTQAPSNPRYGPAASLVAQVIVSAIGGTTPSYTFFIEDSVDGGTTWQLVVAFTAITANGNQVQRVGRNTPFADTLRVRYAVTGTTPTAAVSFRVYCEGPLN